jgi:hypothetical protein
MMMQSTTNDMSINDHIGIILHAQLLILFLLIIPKIGNTQYIAQKDQRYHNEHTAIIVFFQKVSQY